VTTTIRASAFGALVAAALTLSGCAASVSDDVTTASLSSSGQAVAVLSVAVDGPSCPSTTLQLARKTATGYEATQQLHINTSALALANRLDDGLPQYPLSAGEHHIVSYVCRSGNMVSTVGQKQGGVFGFGAAYTKSLATFDLAPGEVVNIGFLRITPIGFTGLVTFLVQDQPLAAMEKLRQAKPKLFAQMKTRLMKVPTAADAPQDRYAYCDMMARLAATQTPRPAPPPQCVVAPAAPAATATAQPAAKTAAR
jgi:hypothetical protein